jgi:hypothetical protein
MDKDQIKILKAFYEADDDYVYNYGWIEYQTEIERKPAKKAMDALRKLGYLQYVCGLFDEDGQTAGSGFAMITQRRDHIKDLLISEGVELDV